MGEKIERKSRRLSAPQRRQQLVDLGTDLLVSRPLEELTVQRVANAAGVSRTLVFHYFPTVRALHLACLEKAADDLMDQLNEAIAGQPASEMLSVGIEAFVDYIALQPNTFLAMSGYASTDAEYGKIFDKVRGQIVGLILHLGGLEDTPMATLLLHGWVTMTETSIVRWLAGTPLEREELFDALTGVLRDLVDRLAAEQAAASSN